MDLVLGGDCFECANKFVYQLARWLVVRLPVKCTTLPLPLPLQDPAKAKHFLPFLQRAGKTAALVEVWRAWWVGQGVGVAQPHFSSPCAQFVASGSRFRLYLPKDTCLVNFLLAGVSCPRAGQTLRSGESIPGEPWGDEGLTYSKELILQREVGGAGERPLTGS